jgi:1,4-dihydroxy-2-naphthoate polyprenyltransferase
MSELASAPPSPLARWWLAVRPKTLSISVVPVVAGVSLAYAQTGSLKLGPALAAAVAALLIQAGTNLHNDAADYERGADGPDRLGPARATAQGWLPARLVKAGAAASFGLAFLLGAYLSAVGGWPIIVLGVAALASGYAYTGGARPIAYSALGEVFVLAFFGLAAVAGSHYLQTLQFSPPSLALGAALGMPAAAVLLLNNYRDLDSDRRAGKLTLCHYLGRQRARVLYALLLLAPFCLAFWPGLPGWPALLALPFALVLIRRLARTPLGPALNGLLADTARLQVLLGALLSAALVFQRW